jgi:outer membrane protein assembly factor BamB
VGTVVPVQRPVAAGVGQSVPQPTPAAPAVPPDTVTAAAPPRDDKPSAYALAWSSPITADGALTLTFTASNLIMAGADTVTEARSLDDGRVLWTSQTRTEHPPVVEAELVILTTGGQMVALEATTGRPRWTAGLNGATRGPSSAQGWIVISSGVELRAYRAADGQLIWTRDLGATATTPPAFAATTVVVPLDDRTFAATDLVTGEPVWHEPLEVTPVAIAAFGDRIYIGAAEGYACAFRQEHGRRDWCFPVRVKPVGRPVADERHVYFAFLDNMVHVFDRRSGRRYYTPSLGALPLSGFVLSASHLVVPVVTGEFVLLDLSSGLDTTRVSVSDAREVPSTRASAVSSDATLLALVTASPAGRSLVCFKARAS